MAPQPVPLDDHIPKDNMLQWFEKDEKLTLDMKNAYMEHALSCGKCRTNLEGVLKFGQKAENPDAAIVALSLCTNKNFYELISSEVEKKHYMKEHGEQIESIIYKMIEENYTTKYGGKK